MPQKVKAVKKNPAAFEKKLYREQQKFPHLLVRAEKLII
jgi:hypothetical protein